MTLCNACGLRNAKRSGHGGTMSEEGVPSPSGAGFVWCYQIQWADGTCRTVRGVHPKLAMKACSW